MSESIAAEPRILAEGGTWLAVEKPVDVHSVPGKAGDDLVSKVIAARPELGLVVGRGRGESGLLQRLDFGTSGIVLFAKDREAFESLSAAQDEGLILKLYAARCDRSLSGLPGSRPLLAPPDSIDVALWNHALAASDEEVGRLLCGNETSLTCLFAPYGPASLVRCSSPGLEVKGKAWTKTAYRTEIRGAVVEGGGLLLEIAIRKGFRHQIRASLAWMGLPIHGDGPYGGMPGERLMLHAAGLAFPDPDGGAAFIRSIPPFASAFFDFFPSIM